MTQNKPLFHPFFWIDWISNCKEELTSFITSSRNGPTGGSGLERKCDLWLLIIKNVSSTIAEVLSLIFLQDTNEGTVLWEFTSISYTGYHPNLLLFRSDELKIHQSQKASVTLKGTNNQQITYQLWIQSSTGLSEQSQ